MTPAPEIRYLKSFIIYALLATLGGAVAGAIQGAILGGIMGGLGTDLRTIQITTGVTGFICGTILSFFIFRWTVQTRIVPQIAKHYQQPLLPIIPSAETNS